MCTVLGNLETNEISDAITTLVNTCRIIQKSQVSRKLFSNCIYNYTLQYNHMKYIKANHVRCIMNKYKYILYAILKEFTSKIHIKFIDQ